MASRAPAELKGSGPESSPAPTPSRHREAPQIRTALKVSVPGDSAEREADLTARKVVAMRLPAARPAVAARASVMPARAPAIPVSRPTAPASSGAPPLARPAGEASPELEQAIRKELGGGKALPPDVAEFMEPRFKANFGNVRIHTDGRAENLATRLGAKAFTYGRDIFFNAGQFKSDTSEGMELIAHELTHTIQQREVVQREAEPFAPVEVHESTSPHVQRGIISRALDWIADKANNIPGFRLFTVVIGVNPVNMSRVERSGANILRALIEFIPGGHLIVEALENHKVFEKGGLFIEEQFRQLGMVGAAFRDALMNFIDSLGWRDIFHLGDLWDRAKRIFTDPIGKLIDFGKGLVKGIAELVKAAIIKPLGAWAARNIPKWNLLVGVFGKNPISDDKESPASALIGAFMELIGQKEIWENIQKGGAVGKAWQWFQTAMKGALALVLSIPGRVMDTIRSLTIFDIVTIVGAFKKIIGAFASFVGDFITWAGGTVLSLLEIIFSVVAPTVVPYLKKAGAAFKTIIKNPGRFISTLVKAGKQGFNQFKAKFVDYLRDALFAWLLGAEGGSIYFPKSFAPLELLKLGLSILGLTWANLRSKLVAATNETVVATLETGFEIVKKLVTEGPAAAWEELLKSLSNLKSMVVDAAIDFVKGEVVKLAIEKLISFLTPAGAFIQAVISIYRTIMFIVDKLAQIGRLVAAFIDGLAALANGVVTTAANKVESVLATGLSLAISFLANFAGLGNVPKKVMQIIKKIRDPVDKAMDKAVAWVVDMAKKLGKMVVAGAKSALQWWTAKLGFTNEDGETHTLQFIGSGESATLGIATSLQSIRTYLDNHADKTSSDSKKKKNWDAANKVFDDSSKVIFGFAKKTAAEAEVRKGIADNLAKISAAFVKLSGAGPKDPDYGTNTPPTYGNPAQVEIAHTTPMTGSAARAWPQTGVWKRIQDAGITRQGYTDRWVQMHIIADKLGGSGDLDANLIPAPNSVNRGPFYGFENKTIALIKARSGGQKNRVWMSVSVSGSKSAPTSITGKAGLYLWMSKKWQKMSSPTLTVSVDVPKPNLTGTRKFSLNFSSPKVMVEELKVPAAIAPLIYRGRPYASRAAWRAKMIADGAAQKDIDKVEALNPLLNE